MPGRPRCWLASLGPMHPAHATQPGQPLLPGIPAQAATRRRLHVRAAGRRWGRLGRVLARRVRLHHLRLGMLAEQGRASVLRAIGHAACYRRRAAGGQLQIGIHPDVHVRGSPVRDGYHSDPATSEKITAAWPLVRQRAADSPAAMAAPRGSYVKLGALGLSTVSPLVLGVFRGPRPEAGAGLSSAGCAADARCMIAGTRPAAGVRPAPMDRGRSRAAIRFCSSPAAIKGRSPYDRHWSASSAGPHLAPPRRSWSPRITHQHQLMRPSGIKSDPRQQSRHAPDLCVRARSRN